jgi:hypothetical protein
MPSLHSPHLRPSATSADNSDEQRTAPASPPTDAPRRSLTIRPSLCRSSAPNGAAPTLCADGEGELRLSRRRGRQRRPNVAGQNSPETAVTRQTPLLGGQNPPGFGQNPPRVGPPRTTHFPSISAAQATRAPTNCRSSVRPTRFPNGDKTTSAPRPRCRHTASPAPTGHPTSRR